MELVVATLNFPPAKGGVEQLCVELARGLHGSGVRVQVVAPAMPGDAAFDAGEPYGVTRFVNDRLRHVRLWRRLASLPLRRGTRVLFGQWTAAGLPVLGRALSLAPLSLSTIVYAKELVNPERGHRGLAAFRLYRSAVLGRLAPVLAISEYTAAHAIRAGARDVRKIALGVDSRRFHPGAAAALPEVVARAAGPTLLSVARLTPRKGIDTVIAALPAIRARHPGAHYFVAGGGGDLARLQALCAQHGVGEHVTFLGRVPDEALPALYAAADLCVLASREDLETGDVEGFGLVLLEAQACGTPVVAARTGGMPDALLPGQTGELVPADDPASLASAVSALLAAPERLSQLGQAARAHAEHRSWQATTAQVRHALWPRG